MRLYNTAILCLAALAGSARAATYTYTYTGRHLFAQTGSGVPGVGKLRFTLAGRMPAKGECESHVDIVAISDGAYTMKQLLRHGFVPAPGNHARICRDGETGALSEVLSATFDLFDGSILDSAYTWKSRDPKRGKMADTVTLFANIEYHISTSKHAGTISASENH